MAGDYMLSVDGVKIGRVMRWVGNKPKERWVGMARRRRYSDPSNEARFPTKREAVAWVEEEAKKLGDAYEE